MHITYERPDNTTVSFDSPIDFECCEVCKAFCPWADVEDLYSDDNLVQRAISIKCSNVETCEHVRNVLRKKSMFYNEEGRE